MCLRCGGCARKPSRKQNRTLIEQNVRLVPSIGWKVPDQVATGAFQSTERPERVDGGKERARGRAGREGWNRTGSVIKHSFQWMTFPGFYN